MSGADLSRYLDIAIAPLRVQLMFRSCKRKEPLHALSGQVSGLMGILPASHVLSF
jgi:hypothetical protein